MYKKIFSILPLIVIFGCQDLLVADITGKEVELYAPKNGAAITASNVTFWWSDIEDATLYNIQVVSPSFDMAQVLWYDSIVPSNKIRFALQPGQFEWRVKAINDVSETNFSSTSFRIDSTVDLTSQNIILYSPYDGVYTNKDSLKFSWSELYNADFYTFSLKNANQQIVVEKKVTTPFMTTSFPEDGSYSWWVKAHNENTETQESGHKLYVDRIPPSEVSLKYPLNNETILGDSVTFKWTKGNDYGSNIHDSLVIAYDEDIYDVVKSFSTEDNNYTCYIDEGVYYWTVISVDKAGNKSRKSTIFTFTKE
ncbi:MAG: hypothetical protein MJZ11_13155 [Lachnospiraceae bacterium]|nr:hypothetical protein [Lachnospiraceae bacterium]